MNKIIQIISIPVLLIIGAAGWSFLSKPTSITINQVTPTIPVVKKETVPTPLPVINTSAPIVKVSPTIAPLVYVNPSATIDAFETAIPAKKYSDLSEFMEPNVTVIKYASSCCGLITKTQAIKEMTYLSDASAPWNFSENNPIGVKLATEDPANFKEAFVGTSTNNYAVGIVLNDKFMISKIIIVNDYRLITGQ